jgi:hypothetical protein
MNVWQQYVQVLVVAAAIRSRIAVWGRRVQDSPSLYLWDGTVLRLV